MKKKILLMVDVPNWAWAYKSNQIKRYLGDEFDFSIWYQSKKVKSAPFDNSYDSYVSFSPIYLNMLRKGGISKNKILVGVTSHSGYDKHLRGKKLHNLCAGIYLNSKMLYNMSSENHNKLFYVPNGVDTKLFVPKGKEFYDSKRELVVGYVGKPTEEKGLSNFIRPAVNKVKNVKLETNTSNCHTSIPLERMPKFYHNIDVYIVASVMDATPNPALEAAACGVPIISNEIGNMPEFIVDSVNGFINKERDINFYVDRLNYFKNNPDRLIEMGIQSRKTAVSWDWHYQIENYRKMFREVLK